MNWLNGDLLFETPHGSHLYGLAHAGSDQDFYRVTKRGRPRQSIVDNIDITTQPYARFLSLCEKGVPQALEAIFSQQATVNHISSITDNFVIGNANMRETYYRTIRNFWDGSYKQKRHAVRLLLNLQEALGRGQGRFNPTLSPYQIEYIEWYVENKDEIPTL